MSNRSVYVKNVDTFVGMIVKAGYSYRQLAKEANVDPTTISLIIKGERNPSPKTAVDICTALRCQFDDIFFIENAYKSN